MGMSGTPPEKSSRPGSVLLHGALVAIALLSMSPFLWLLCAAFKTPADLFSSLFLPWHHLDRLTLGNFTTLFHTRPFGTWLLNSLFLASAQTVLVVTFSSLGGFALAKYRFRFRRLIILLMLATVLLPSQVLLPSLYELMDRLGLVNTYTAILAPNAVSVLGMFLFWQAMRAVPDELLQAGRVDGCSEWRLWWSVALPIVRPMVGAFTLLSFLGAWNSFLWPQIILQDEAKYPLPLGLANLMGLQEYQSHYGLLMAATLLSVLPVVILFFILQKDFITGLSSGAVKG
jgi:ABC-type glycerol-3-phosphate transport system permease component